MFAQPRSWLVRTAAGTGRYPDLQSAIVGAVEQSLANNPPMAIVMMPDDAIEILPDQIHRLSKKFNFTDPRTGNIVRPSSTYGPTLNGA